MRDILLQGAKVFGIDLDEESFALFATYHSFLEEKNSVMDLTAISGGKNVAQLHFLDSLALMKLLSFSDSTVIDIGSGAGFPGLPIKIAEKSVKLTLLDAQQKRVSFLDELCKTLKLDDVQCVHARAEEAALKTDIRDHYDYAVSRAVARLNVLAELCLPFVKTGGAFIAMKGTDSNEEITEAEGAVKRLGGRIENKIDYTIPDTDITHRAIIIRKISPTPDGFPRRFAKIQKSPLSN